MTRRRLDGALQVGISIAVAAGGCTSAAPATNDGASDGGAGSSERPAAGSYFVPVEGTRIKARWAEAPAGQRTFDGWYDTELATPCSFRKAADGAFRCLPTGYALGATPSDFADPACTTPVAVYRPVNCSPHPLILRPDTTNPCEPRERVYRRGEPIAENRTFWRPTTGECIPGGLLPDAVAYRIGAELPVTMFVKGDEVVRPAGNPAAALDMVVMEAEDGTRTHTGWQNARAGTRCGFWRLSDDRLHCLPPVATSTAAIFSDAACSVPAAFYRPACHAQPPSYAVEVIKDVCPTRFDAVALAAPLDSVFRLSDGVCQQNASPAGTQFHARGAAAALEDFAPLDLVPDPTSSQRLRRQLISAPEGQRSLSWDWFDTARQEACGLFSFGAGRYRCAPHSSQLSFYFADAQCTRPVWRGRRGECPPRHAHRWDTTVCPYRATIHQVGGLHGGPTFVRTQIRSPTSASLECRPNAAPAPDDLFFSVTAIPETEFAELKLIARP